MEDSGHVRATLLLALASWLPVCNTHYLSTEIQSLPQSITGRLLRIPSLTILARIPSLTILAHIPSLTILALSSFPAQHPAPVQPDL